ncbi:transposase [Solibacillus sp. A46]|uniref:Transposase n=1 Tax=Solibacillus faecavium TaxID=2762221 RepID=A0ABR8XTU0_9BACL|nr:transposase [Solibacillus faecavium]MBD8035353.1 transposase [Solibacillus faecavium]
MAKFTLEEKLQAVFRYIKGNESSHEIAKTIGTDHKAILNWAKQ